jgi:hypothetical protein
MAAMGFPSAITRRRHRRAGFALEAVILLMVLFSVVVLAGLTTVSTMARTSGADYQAARALYSMEATGDDLMAQLDVFMQDGLVTAAEIGQLEAPQLAGYAVTQSTVNRGAPTLRTVSSGPYTGLYAMSQVFDITVMAKDSTQARAGSVLTVNAQSLPVFQFAVFYDQDLELFPGPPMTFDGRVHSNDNLYLRGNVIISGMVTTPESTFMAMKQDDAQTVNNVWLHNGAGQAVKLNFDSRSLGDAAYRQQSELKFNSRLMSKAHGVRPLKLPLPGNTPAWTLLLPRSDADDGLTRTLKMAWKSDWVVTVRAGVFAMADTVAMKAAFCDSLVMIRAEGLEVPSPAACRRIFKPRPNAFLDGRENRRPDLIDIHVDSLRIWSDSAPATRAPRVLYLSFVNAPLGAPGDLVAVRLRQAREVPRPRSTADSGGLTVATDRPMYVLGDFNSVNWLPSALMADVLVFLSNPPNAAMSAATTVPSSQRCGVAAGWCDNQQSTLVRRMATNTTQNAAILAGHTPTSCDWQRAGCPNPTSGGGVHNMMGYRESWSGVNHHYTGSIVSLFGTRYFHNEWSLAYYAPPHRIWAFDTRFQNPNLLPPGTPAVGNVVQTAFRPLY